MVSFPVAGVPFCQKGASKNLTGFREIMAGFREVTAGFREVMAGFREVMGGFREVIAGSSRGHRGVIAGSSRGSARSPRGFREDSWEAPRLRKTPQSPWKAFRLPLRRRWCGDTGCFDVLPRLRRGAGLLFSTASWQRNLLF